MNRVKVKGLVLSLLKHEQFPVMLMEMVICCNRRIRVFRVFCSCYDERAHKWLTVAIEAYPEALLTHFSFHLSPNKMHTICGF